MSVQLSLSSILPQSIDYTVNLSTPARQDVAGTDRGKERVSIERCGKANRERLDAEERCTFFFQRVRIAASYTLDRLRPSP